MKNSVAYEDVDPKTRLELEIESYPDVWFVLVDYKRKDDWWKQPLYAVQLPQDLDRFRLQVKAGFNVWFKFHNRWYPILGAWKQLKRLNLDAAENIGKGVVNFAGTTLKKLGVKPWKGK